LWSRGQQVTFPFLHWIKGVPFAGVDADQGAYESLTWWEQLDSGAQFTTTKKILTLVPIILFASLSLELCPSPSLLISDTLFQSYATSLYVSDGIVFLLANTVVSIPIIVAKMPFMHRVRIFGINK